MLTKEVKDELKKQKYAVIGSHAAVKICGWTKKMIKGEGGCYKLTFYGIQSNQCMQMTTSLSCANRCIFCWRGYKAPVTKEWTEEIDEPKMILEGAKKAHEKLLTGINGYKNVNKELYKESKEIKHVALSLTGEAITYPKINEFIDLCHQNKISTFLVTNAQYPELIRTLRPITQLYISLDAPTKELLKEIDKPLFSDYWERLQESLDVLAKRKDRTCIRLTLIKEKNMCQEKEYAELIQKADPDFIEVKAYMLLGASREQLRQENMPLHEEVVEFTKKLAEYLPEYEIVTEHIPSRVVLLAKKKYKEKNIWKTWIDFEEFHKTINKNFNKEKIRKETPETGLSGKGTRDYKIQT